MIKINEWVGDYYTYGRLNSQGFCALEDLEHSLDKHQWDKAKAIEYVMWNHNIEKDQAMGMIEWAMSMLTMPGFVVAEDVPEPETAEATESYTKDGFYRMLREKHGNITNAIQWAIKWAVNQDIVPDYGEFTLRAMATHISLAFEGVKHDPEKPFPTYTDTKYGMRIYEAMCTRKDGE